MNDKYLIDSHKYIYHPQHSAIILDYIENRENNTFKERFKNLHPKYIEVSPVGACNHRCTFCAVDYIGYKSQFIDYEIYCNSIKSMKGKGCSSIMFAGEGEPLLHPMIGDIVNFTKEEGNIDTSFTTNAFKLTEDFIEKSLRNISWIKVSFNAGNKKTYANIHRTSEKDFDIVVDNLKRCVDFKKRKNIDTALGMQMLLLPDNRETVHELCIIAKEIGMDYVVIKPYSQHKFSNTHKYENIDYTDYFGLEEELKQYSDNNFSVIFRINTIKNWISQNNDRYCKCLATPSTWGYIMADGSVYTCSAYLLDERFKIGNINNDTFNNIWCSDRRIEHSDFIFNELNISECRVNCRMDQVNRYLDKIVNKTVDHMNFI